MRYLPTLIVLCQGEKFIVTAKLSSLHIACAANEQIPVMNKSSNPGYEQIIDLMLIVYYKLSCISTWLL